MRRRKVVVVIRVVSFCHYSILIPYFKTITTIVEDSGLDVDVKECGTISPYGVCTLWDTNEQESL